MESQKINMFVMTNGKKFNPQQLPIIIEGLKKSSDDNFMLISSIHFNTPTNWLLLYLFTPFFIIDRFIFGTPVHGILKFITMGGFGIWALIDIFNIMSRVREKNFNKIKPYLS